jgi:hypothetical protein
LANNTHKQKEFQRNQMNKDNKLTESDNELTTPVIDENLCEKGSY